MPSPSGTESQGDGDATLGIRQAETVHAARRNFILLVGLLGLVIGLEAVIFQWALFGAEVSRGKIRQHLAGVPFGWAVLPVVCFAGAGLAGWLVQRVEPDASGSGIPHVKGVLLHLRPMRWLRLTFVKFFGGILAIGSGLSLGREGPTVQLGAAAGAAFGQFFRTNPRLTPQLISCGAGAGLAAAFNAPLAGFLFVIEELRREMSPTTYGGALVAAVCADIVTRSMTGQLPAFRITTVETMPLSALPAVIALGVLLGAVAVVWNRAIVAGSAMMSNVRRVPRWLQSGIMGAIVGLVAWWAPQAVGGGHSTAEWVLNGGCATATIGWLGGMLVLKFVLTVGSYSTGAPGGIFAPMLLMGSLAGALAGRAVGAAFPVLGVDPSAMAILGMAAWFAGSVRAPLTGMVLMLEMTGNYHQLFALSVVCLVAYLMAEQLRDEPIYDALLEADLHRRGVNSGDDVEARHVVFGIQNGSAVEGKKVRDAGFPAGCLVVGLERRGKEFVPHGSLVIEAGDHITVIFPAGNAEAALAIVDMCRGS
ncbi:MAG: H(+)/Cl(-) exchange transporter ClcA [Phycisphaeraceae bacterium]|nr:H(+)/Cl(-) exchange transporter ClcA [Phycisphaeraceae bacterium]